jgi:hypothetical protein
LSKTLPNFIDKLGDQAFEMREAAQADLTALLARYIARGDLTRAGIVLGNWPRR